MRKSLLSMAVLVFMLLEGCSGRSSAAAKTGGLRVLAIETFLGDIAQNVAGNRLKVETLLPVGVDPHGFQPAPRDAIKIAQSQVLIMNGLGYETWLTKTLENTGGQRLVVVVSTGLSPNPAPSGGYPAGDPHLWMNPLNVVHYVENLRDGLTQADPGGREMYAANAQAYIAQLKALDQWVKTEVAAIPPGKRLLVTDHDALGYFSQAYGFKVVGAVIPSVTDEASPSAQQLAALIDAIKSSGAPAIFLDIGGNRKLADQIASESGAKVVTDLYVETISAPDGPAGTYIEMIKHDVNEIVNALK